MSKDAMKICLIAPVPPFRGGIAKYCLSLAKVLEQRHDLLLLSYGRQYPVILYGKKSQIDPDIELGAVQRQFRNLSYDIDSANPLSWRRTVRTIVGFGAETVILPWWVVYWMPMYLYLVRALRKKGIGILFLCINVFEHEDNSFKKFLVRLMLKRVDRVIVHSEEEARQVREINRTAQVTKHLLPLFSYPAVPPGKRDGTLNLLFFGFVRPYKGLDTLIQALALLKERDVRLTVAGEFWNDKATYESLIRENGLSDRVNIIAGYIPESGMSRYFADADVVVLPYKKSITSGVIATAYGFGKPVLATSVGGFGEVVQDGVTGKIVPPGAPQPLADGISWFLYHREIDFAKNIRSFTSKKMSWESLTDAVERLCGEAP